MSRAHDADQLALQGRVSAQIKGAKTGDRIVVVVEGTFRAFEEISAAHTGDYTVAKARTGEALILSDAEAGQFQERLAELRHLSNGGVKGQESLGIAAEAFAKTGEYGQLKAAELRTLCKERGYSQSGTKEELIQRLKDNDPQ